MTTALSSRFKIDVGPQSVQRLLPPSKAERFEGIDFSTSGKVLAIATSDTNAVGRQTRTFCYITDAISGFLKTLLKGQSGEPYNIGNSNNEVSMVGLAEMFKAVVPGTAVNFINYPETTPPASRSDGVRT